MVSDPGEAIQWTRGATTGLLFHCAFWAWPAIASDEAKRISARQGRGQASNRGVTVDRVLMLWLSVRIVGGLAGCVQACTVQISGAVCWCRDAMALRRCLVDGCACRRAWRLNGRILKSGRLDELSMALDGRGSIRRDSDYGRRCACHYCLGVFTSYLSSAPTRQTARRLAFCTGQLVGFSLMHAT